MTKCLQYHYKIVRFKCYNNAEYGNSSSADSRLRTGGELAWTTTTIETIRDPTGATVPTIGGRAAQGAPIRLPAGKRTPNGDLRPMIEAPIARIAVIPRRAEALPARIGVILRRAEAPPARIAAILRRAETPPARIAAIPRRVEAPPARIVATRPPTGRTTARAVLRLQVDRARRARAAAIRPLRAALPAPAAAPAEAAMAVLPVPPAHREKRKRSGATSSVFSRDSSS